MAIIFYVYMGKVSPPSPKFETGEIVYPERYVKTARLSDCTYTNPIPTHANSSALLNGVEIIDSTFCEFTTGLYRDTYLYEIKLFPSENTYYAVEEWLYDYKRHVPISTPTPVSTPRPRPTPTPTPTLRPPTVTPRPIPTPTVSIYSFEVWGSESKTLVDRYLREHCKRSFPAYVRTDAEINGDSVMSVIWQMRSTIDGKTYVLDMGDWTHSGSSNFPDNILPNGTTARAIKASCTSASILRSW